MMALFFWSSIFFSLLLISEFNPQIPRGLPPGLNKGKFENLGFQDILERSS